MSQKEQLFSEAAKDWELTRLYQNLESTKQNQLGEKRLTSLQKICLQGLLCGYSPEQIASQLPGELQGLIVTLTWRLHECIRTMIGIIPSENESYRDIPNWLEAAGYKKKEPKKEKFISSPLVFNPYQLQFRYEDLKIAPDVEFFYGRSQEQDTLKQWIQKEQCRLVAVVGIFGIGKTTLAAKVTQEIKSEFDYVIWRTVSHAPPLSQLLEELIQCFSNGQIIDLPEDTHIISKLITYLQASRCLLILDDWQFVMDSPKEHQNYSELLQQVGQIPHQSCLLINSSEKTSEISLLEGDKVRTLQLEGLGKSARSILKAKGLLEEPLWDKLITIYRGNPRELKLISTTINDLFGGKVSEFFNQNTCCGIIVHQSSKKLLTKQFERLSQLELEVLKTLAIHRQPMEREQLPEKINSNVYSSELILALESLVGQSLIEIIIFEGKQSIALQPMVMKHVIREYLPANVSTKPLVEIVEPDESKFVPKQTDSKLVPTLTTEGRVVKSGGFQSNFSLLAVWLLGIGTIIGVTLYLFLLKSTNQTEKTSTIPVESVPEVTIVAALGRIQPKDKIITLSGSSAVQSARVSQILVKEEEKVKHQQVIAILDNHNQLQATLEQAKLNAKVAEARLARVKAGESKKGEISAQKARIANLEAQFNGDVTIQKTKIARLEVQLENAKKEYIRFKELNEKGGISALQVDNKLLALKTLQEEFKEGKATLAQLLSTSLQKIEEAKATLNKLNEVRSVDVQVAQTELEKALAAVRKAKVDLDLVYVRSPIDGQILKIHTFPGESISNKGIVDLVQNQQMYVLAEIYETKISQIRIGQKAIISSNALTRDLKGTVEQIGSQIGKKDVFNNDPSLDIDSRVVEVKIRLDSADNQQAAKLINLQVEVEIDTST